MAAPYSLVLQQAQIRANAIPVDFLGSLQMLIHLFADFCHTKKLALAGYELQSILIQILQTFTG